MLFSGLNTNFLPSIWDEKTAPISLSIWLSFDRDKIWKVINDLKIIGVKKTLENLTSRWFTDEFILKNPDLVSRRLNQVIDTVDKLFMSKNNSKNIELKIKALGNKILNLTLKEVNFFVNK